MGPDLLTPPTLRELEDLAEATGFRLDMLEKVVRLLALADDIAANPPTVEADEMSRQLRPMLTRTDGQRTRPASADTYLAELEAKAAPARRMVVPLTAPERAFLDALLDRGRVEPHLLTADERLQNRIATEPRLRWKAHNVRKRRTDQTPCGARP